MPDFVEFDDGLREILYQKDNLIIVAFAEAALVLDASRYKIIQDATKTALEDTIKQFESAILGKTTTPVDLALCNAFLVDECKHCPVTKKLGSRYCVDSPLGYFEEDVITTQINIGEIYESYKFLVDLKETL